MVPGQRSRIKVSITCRIGLLLYYGDYVSVYNQNYITTDVTISQEIHIIFSLILFSINSNYKKSFYFIYTVDLTYIQISCNCIYIYNQIRVYRVHRKANLHIDLKNLILINISFILLISKHILCILMHKALHPRDDWDRLYVSRKAGGKRPVSIEDSVDASLQWVEEYIKKRAKEDWLQWPETTQKT